MTNLFGFDLAGLDVPGFASALRLAFVAIAVLGAVLAARKGDDRRTGRIVLAVGVAGHVLAWFATMFPLPNVYGANGSTVTHLGPSASLLSLVKQSDDALKGLPARR